MNAITNNRDTTRSQNFTYDTLNRIATAKTTSTTGSNWWGLQLGIDVWANMTSATVTQCTAPMLNVTAASNNRLSGFSYDAAGNMLNDGSNSYVFNAENQITTGAGVTYSYDGDGKRVKKSSGTLYWYDTGTDAVDETDGTGSTTNSSFNEYVLFGGKRIARRDASSNVFYYFEDHLGTSRVVVQSGQTSPCYDADFYPFGGERIITNICPQNYKFTGKERDAESGLDNFGFRNYASTMGRWMTPDPLNLTSARLVNPTNTLNKYVYGANNPLKYIDKDGKDIAIFYRPPSGASGDYGHIMLGALNQATGKTAFLDYYPAGKVNGFGQGPGAFNQGNMSERAQQNAEGKFATLTIQTSPEEAQKVINLIEALKNGPTADYSALINANNCTTVCEDVLHDLGLDFGDVLPSSYWADVYNNFSADALAHPIWTRMMGVHSTRGNEYGNPRNFPGVTNFSQWLFTLYMNKQQQPQPKACVEVDDGLGNHSKHCE